MTTIKILILALVLSTLTPFLQAAGKLHVVATVPDLVDIAKRVGGDLVIVDGIARGKEDIHQVVMRPSFVSKLNQADAVVYLGLTVEHSFLPGLLDVANSLKMKSDPIHGCVGSGCIDCSKGVNVLEKPANVN